MRIALAISAAVTLAACQRSESGQVSAAVDCTRIAETLATFEIGEAATPAQRAPAVAKHRAACESAHVTAQEAACLGHAKDTWAARACLPRMFAAPAPVGEQADCAVVASRMRAAVVAEVGQGLAAMNAMAKLLPTIQASCEQDRWPKNVLSCVAATKVGDMASFQACTNQLPQDLQDKLSRRLTALQAEPAPPPTATPPAK